MAEKNPKIKYQKISPEEVEAFAYSTAEDFNSIPDEDIEEIIMHEVIIKKED